jgi:signal transduction histidine kinase
MTIGGVAQELGVPSVVDNVVDDYLQKVIEERCRATAGALVEGIATAIWCFDATGRIQIANRAAQELGALVELSGQGAALRVGGRDLFELLGAPSPLCWDYSAHHRHIELRSQITVLDGHSRLVVVGTDVTQARATLHRLAEMERRASIGILGAGVAHEINNPLAFIASNVQTLGEYLIDLGQLCQGRAEARAILDDTPGLLQESLAGLERIRTIVKDLLTYSAVGDSEPSSVASLGSLVDEALRLAGAELRERATIEVMVCSSPRVRVQPRNLVDVVIDLARNAADACSGLSRDARRIVIGIGQDRDRALLEVRDNGCGIPARLLPRIFDPFFTTKGPGAGSTGLGLSTALAIIRRQGGELAVASLEGAGTTVRMSLPVAG